MNVCMYVCRNNKERCYMYSAQRVGIHAAAYKMLSSYESPYTYIYTQPTHTLTHALPVTLYIYIYIHTHTHTAYTHTYTCVTSQPIYIYIYTPIYIYTYTHTHSLHTHIHMHIHNMSSMHSQMVARISLWCTDRQTDRCIYIKWNLKCTHR
jgi:hypothetical protein